VGSQSNSLAYLINHSAQDKTDKLDKIAMRFTSAKINGVAIIVAGFMLSGVLTSPVSTIACKWHLHLCKAALLTTSQ
jgi:hypothetical protein